MVCLADRVCDVVFGRVLALVDEEGRIKGGEGRVGQVTI